MPEKKTGKNRFKFIAAAIAMTFCAAGPAISAELDKATLKAGIAGRINTVIEQQGGNDAQSLKGKDVDLIRVEPATVSIGGQDFDLYAVKAAINLGGGQETVMMVVDDRGTAEITVRDVATGNSLLQDAKDRINRKEIDPEIGETITTGSGDRDVVFVSDPFCPYCRDAFAYFLDNKDHVGNWRIVHLTYGKQPASETAIWAAMDGADTIGAMELTRFIYSDLERPDRGTPENISEAVIEQFMGRFPELSKKWGSAEQARYYLKGKYQEKARQEMKETGQNLEIEATPTIFIDGTPVVGWAPDRYEALLTQ